LSGHRVCSACRNKRNGYANRASNNRDLEKENESLPVNPERVAQRQFERQ
jgi:hypothetical protein